MPLQNRSPEMAVVRTYRVSGIVAKPGSEMRFTKEVKAIKPEDALEKVYCEVGSHHKAKRFEIRITRLEELPEA
ncbi:MAG: 50S ribosomal protein L18Ae [Candidatus Bathyarchaeia archaeon]